MIEWKPVPGYVGVYWVAEHDGKVVIRNARGQWLTPTSSPTGDYIELRKDGRRERYMIDRLLFEAFSDRL